MRYRLSTFLVFATLLACIIGTGPRLKLRYEQHITQKRVADLMDQLSTFGGTVHGQDLSSDRYIQFSDTCWGLLDCQSADIGALNVGELSMLLNNTPSFVDSDIEMLYPIATIFVSFMVSHQDAEQGHRLLVDAILNRPTTGGAESAMMALSEFADPYDRRLFRSQLQNPNESVAMDAETGIERISIHKHEPSFSVSYQQQRAGLATEQ